MKTICLMICLMIPAFVVLSEAEAPATEVIRVACVGDSITSARGPTDKTSYPAQLGQLLGDGYSVRNFGVSGRTLLSKGNNPYIQTPEYRQALEFAPDIVVIKLGTNDSKPVNWSHKDDYVPEYIELIESFKSLESSPDIWICLPVPAFETRWGIDGQVIRDEIIPKVKAVAAASGVSIIDLHEPFLDDKGLFPDMIHPNPQGRGKIARIVADHIAADSDDADD